MWYILFTIVAGGLLVFGFFSDSLITILICGLIVLLGFIYSHRKPRVMHHELTATGIVLGDTIYPYKNIKTFWIIYEPPHIKTLNLETTAYLNSHVVVQLGNQDPVMVKLFLKNFLEEDLNREESFVDLISRKLKI